MLTVLVGAFVPVAEVLWDPLSVTLVERTGVRGTHADRKPTHYSYIDLVQISSQQANKLSTVKKCLNEVLKCGGSFSVRDLYPVSLLLPDLVTPSFLCAKAEPCCISRQYQLALYQIDSLRVDGKFPSADGTIPEGQGIVMAHLNECHELVEMVCSS